MSDLRKRVIKLAYDNPELRADLVPTLIEDDLRIISAGMGKKAEASVIQLTNMLAKKYDRFKRSPFVKNLRVILKFLATAGRKTWVALARMLKAIWRYLAGEFECEDLLSQQGRLERFVGRARANIKKAQPDFYRQVLYLEAMSNSTPKLIGLHEELKKRGDAPLEAMFFLEMDAALAMTNDEINYYYC